jgi:HAD superfamily hydrolase (TIGR01509 family)
VRCRRGVSGSGKTERVVQGVLFDLFETLMTEFVIESAGPPVWGAPGDALGVEEASFRRGWADRKDRRMTSELSYIETLTEICHECGVVPPATTILELHELRQSRRREAFAAIPAAVLEMLDELRSTGLRTAIVSNCSVEEAEHLEQSELEARVDACVLSFREGVQKPDPAIYLRACERLGVEPSDAVFVGDGSFDELRGASAAGLEPIWASWFTAGWPALLAERRRLEVEHLRVAEASSPKAVVSLIFDRRNRDRSHPTRA